MTDATNHARSRRDIDILFSTRNGAATLPHMLDALCALRTDGLRWRVIAVDNASTDDTPRVLRAFKDRLPLTCLHEPRRGKNIGLNTGLGAVASDILVLTDDDVLPAPDWLLALKATFERYPQIDVVGGPIRPLWPRQPPAWLDGVPFGGAYGATPPGTAEGPVSPRLVWGANMALRTQVFNAGLRFTETIGPNGSRFYTMGSETDFLLRVHARGHRFWHSADAVVHHMIRPHQLTRRWLWGRALRQGRGQARMLALLDPITLDHAASLFGIPRYLVRELAVIALGMPGALVRGPASRRMEVIWTLLEKLSFMAECRALRRADASSRKPLRQEVAPRADHARRDAHAPQPRF